MCYTLLRKILFCLPPECAHAISLKALNVYGAYVNVKPFDAPVKVMGLTFPNSVGIAAGLDKNADYLPGLATLGVGSIEVGTVTPRPQAGNSKPRLFRLPEANALINRLGFNNKGVDYLVERLKKRTFTGILGVNIGKNRDTPLSKAAEDYVYCFERVYPYADYVTINVSSPNTPGLRDLQYEDYLDTLLLTLKRVQAEQARQHKKYVPLVLKVAPDLSEDEVESVAASLRKAAFDGVIATNTTIERPQELHGLSHANEQGGLSGAPLFASSTRVLTHLDQVLQGDIPIIGCGGIFSAADVRKKIEMGAALVQIYTGLVYQGPGWVRKLYS